MSKVCVLSQRVPYPPNKGEKLRTYHQIEFLNRLGYEVEVFSLIETEEDKKNAEALAKHLGISVNSYQLGSKFTRYASALLQGLPISVGAFYSKTLQHVIDEKLKEGDDALLLTASSLSYYIFNSPYYNNTHCPSFIWGNRRILPLAHCKQTPYLVLNALFASIISSRTELIPINFSLEVEQQSMNHLEKPKEL